MNLGTLLSKPGESNYSVYRRFLIANHALNRNLEDIQSGMKQNFHEHFGNDVVYPSLIEAIHMIEGKRFKNEQIILEHNKVYDYWNERPLKSCKKCSEIGYHSNYFDLQWVTRCPVHNSILLGKCPLCHKWWPSGKELFNRKCKCCGVNVKIKNILNKYRIDLKVFKRMRNYLSQIKKHQSLNRNIVLFSGFNKVENFCSINTNSAYTIEALKDFNLINNVEYIKCGEIGSYKYDSIRRSFQCKEIKGKKLRSFVSKINSHQKCTEVRADDELLEKYNNLKHQVSIRFSQLISNSQKYGLHPVGINCTTEYGCKTCQIWSSWLDIAFPYNSEYIGTDHEIHYERCKAKAPKLITNILIKNDPNASIHGFYPISDHETLRLKKELKNGKVKLLEIPNPMSLLLHEIELWIIANKLIFENLHLNSNTHQSEMFSEFINLDNNFSKSIDFHSIYLNVNKDSIIDISFPKKLLEDSILDSYGLRKLISKAS